MLFVGYVEGSQIDLTVKATNGDIIEYFFNLKELKDELGEDAEYQIIFLVDVEIKLYDNGTEVNSGSGTVGS